MKRSPEAGPMPAMYYWRTPDGRLVSSTEEPTTAHTPMSHKEWETGRMQARAKAEEARLAANAASAAARDARRQALAVKLGLSAEDVDLLLR